jgi:hypothetical protein
MMRAISYTAKRGVVDRIVVASAAIALACEQSASGRVMNGTRRGATALTGAMDRRDGCRESVPRVTASAGHARIDGRNTF